MRVGAEITSERKPLLDSLLQALELSGYGAIDHAVAHSNDQAAEDRRIDAEGDGGAAAQFGEHILFTTFCSSSVRAALK